MFSLNGTQQRLFMKYVCDVEEWAHKSWRAPLSNTHFITEIKSQSLWWSSLQQNTNYTLSTSTLHLHEHLGMLLINQPENSFSLYVEVEVQSLHSCGQTMIKHRFTYDAWIHSHSLHEVNCRQSVVNHSWFLNPVSYHVAPALSVFLLSYSDPLCWLTLS